MKQKVCPEGNQRFSFRAFTLIEVLVVIAIIGLLASIIMVSIKEVRERARVAAGLNFAAQVHHALGAYVAGIWDFNEGSGGTATDTSGNGNNGTINGAVYQCASTNPDYTPSGEGCSLSFDGGDDYVQVSASSELTNAALQYTVSVWIKPQVDGDYWTGVVGKPGRNYNFWLGESNDPNGGYVHHRFHTAATWNDYCPSTSTDSIPMNKWSQVVLTNNGSECKTYINGKEEVKRTFGSSLISDSTSLYIGRNLDGGASNYYRGIIDDVRIYGEALSSAQIKKLYVEGAREKGLVVENDK